MEAKDKSPIKLDYNKISNAYAVDIDHKDAPDYCDAYIESAWYDGREMTEEELEVLNQDDDYIYEIVFKQLF